MITAFSIAWTPILFSIVKEDNAKKILANLMTYFFLISFSISLLISMFSEDIVRLISVGEYINSYKIVPLISFSYFLYGIYVFLLSGLMITKKIGNQPVIIGMSVLVNICFNLLLIPRLGYIGAAYATLFTYTVVVIGTYFISQRYYYLNYERARLFKITTLGILIYHISCYKFWNVIYIALFWKLTLFILFYYLLYLWNFFNLKEQNQIRYLFQKVGIYA